MSGPAVTLTPPCSTGAGRWRVNIDVRKGSVTARRGESPLRVLDVLIAAGAQAAVIDLDRSAGQSAGTTLLEAAVRRHPGQVWAGGHLAPGTPETARLLDAGAAGVIISSGALFAGGQADHAALAALAATPEPWRVMAAVDAAAGEVRCHGFTAGTGVPVTEALDALAQAAGGQVAVLYTDVHAALRQAGPGWDTLAAATARCPGLPLWYAGGLDSWAAMTRPWQLGYGAITGRAYLHGTLGLPAA